MKATRIAALMAALACIPTMADAQDLTPAGYYELRNRADSLYRSANLQAAEPLVRRLLAYDERDGEVWVMLARTLTTQGKRAEAVVAYKKAIETGFEYAPNWMLNIARLEALQNHPDAALEWLERALAGRLPSRERLRNDSAFVGMRGDARFRKLAGVPPDNLTRDEKFRFDLDYLVEEAKRLHVSFDRFAFSPAFDSAAASLRRRIPQLTDEEIIGELRKLLVILDDGHTGAFFDNPPRLPVSLYWFKDGVFVFRDVRDAVEPLPGDTTVIGSRVVAVNGVPVEQALARLGAFITRDNDMNIRNVAPSMIGNRAAMRVAGMLTDTNAVTLSLRTRNGQAKELTLPFEAPQPILTRLNTLTGDSAARPLWLQAPRRAFWLKPLPESNAVYVQFNAVRNEPGQSLAQFAKTLGSTLTSTGARNVIIDLRHNGGGNSYLFPPLLRTLIVFKEAAPEHRVFVIIGRATFSAAQNFASAVDQLVGATFVGEPSGSRINFVGESDAFRLPATGVRANISWRWHQYGQWVDQRKWIAPRIPVEMTSADYFAGRDVVLEAILEVIGQ